MIVTNLKWSVSPEVGNLNPNLDHIPPFDKKSLWQATFFVHQWAYRLCGKAANSFGSLKCGVLVWVARKQMRS